MQISFLELARSSLNVLNILFDGEDPDANTGKMCRLHFNLMLDSLAADKLAIYTERNDIFTLVPGTATYTVGPTGAWVMPRPVEITAAQTRYTSINEQPLDIVSNDTYNAIRTKGITNSVQYVMGFLPSYPNASVSFYPTPSAANPVRITSKVQFDSVTSMTQIIEMPPGYLEMFIYNLAFRISTGQNKPMSQSAQDLAASSLALIKSNNLEDTPLSIGDPLGRDGMAWNPNTGYWARA